LLAFSFIFPLDHFCARANEFVLVSLSNARSRSSLRDRPHGSHLSRMPSSSPRRAIERNEDAIKIRHRFHRAFDRAIDSTSRRRVASNDPRVRVSSTRVALVESSLARSHLLALLTAGESLGGLGGLRFGGFRRHLLALERASTRDGDARARAPHVRRENNPF
jgi:hypothetical protein